MSACWTLTSNWDGMGFLVGSDLTVVHFFLSWELTSTTRLSFAHLSEKGTPSHDVLNWLHLFPYLKHLNTHVCLALAVQYFLFLSASHSWPFLQHWPQTNIIFRFGGPNLLWVVENCRQIKKKTVKICLVWQKNETEQYEQYSIREIKSGFSFYLGSLQRSCCIPILVCLLNNTFMRDTCVQNKQIKTKVT